MSTDPIRLVVLCSPSGAGKTTLAHMLLEDPTLSGIHFSVSHTTRRPRPGERDGRDYHFVDVETFRSILDRDGFAEHATVHANLYGTSIEEIERISSLEGARAIIFDIDVQGARQLAARYPDAIRIFILPPSIAELRARLEGRGTEDTQQLALRLRNAMGEVRHHVEFDHVIVNDDLGHAYAELRGVVENPGNRPGGGREAAEALLAAWEAEEKG